MTSKCGKNIKLAYQTQLSASMMFLTTFDVFFELLLDGSLQQKNLFVLCEKSKMLFMVSVLQ